MKRFRGEKLPLRPRIALFQNDALGNYVVSTPLIAMLRSRYPDAEIHLFAGNRTQELWAADPRLSCGFAMYGSTPLELAEAIRAATGADGIDLVVNMEWHATAKVAAAMACGPETYVVGPCIGPEGRSDLEAGDDERGRLLLDQEWISADLAERYELLQTGFIGEIFCRLAFLDGPIPRYELPTVAVSSKVPDVLIATSASLPEKLWPVESWLEAVSMLRAKGLSVGLLGAPPAQQARYWRGNDTEGVLVDRGGVHDLRGKFSLPEVVGALAAAKRVLTLDNGILHLAAATATPTVGLFRFGYHRLWAPPADNICVLIPEPEAMVATIPVEAAVRSLELE